VSLAIGVAGCGGWGVNIVRDLVALRAGWARDAARATVSMNAASLQVLTIPPGVLHGIFTPESSLILNGLSHEFDPCDDLAVRYDDPALALDWRVVDPVLSPRDRAAPMLAEFFAGLRADGVVLPTLEA
jgi:dTDP-4-dehydrorhamnose 3,5-epimerase